MLYLKLVSRPVETRGCVKSNENPLSFFADTDVCMFDFLLCQIAMDCFGFLQSPFPDVEEIEMVAITSPVEDLDYFDCENHFLFGPSSPSHTTCGPDVARAEPFPSDQSVATTSSIVTSDLDMPRDAKVQHFYVGEPYRNPTEYPPPFLAPPFTQPQRLRPVRIYYQIWGGCSWSEEF